MDKPRQKPLELFTPEELWRQTVLAKVDGLIPEAIFQHMDRCGREELYRTCKGCGDWTTFYYKCCLKFCPLCNWRIARTRAQLLKLWSTQIKQPKHVVLTQKNFPILTRRKIRDFGRAFAKLRRNKLWRDVKGGCISTEITNEGQGWHLHAHILADVRWLDASVLAIEWGKLVGQQFGIVKVKDVREQSYFHEVTKYVVKGSQLAAWDGNEIAQFIHAIKGVRFFAAFGSLFKMQRVLRLEIERQKPEPKPCACGCDDYRYETEATAILGELRRKAR